MKAELEKEGRKIFVIGYSKEFEEEKFRSFLDQLLPSQE